MAKICHEQRTSENAICGSSMNKRTQCFKDVQGGCVEIVFAERPFEQKREYKYTIYSGYVSLCLYSIAVYKL